MQLPEGESPEQQSYLSSFAGRKSSGMLSHLPEWQVRRLPVKEKQ